MELLLFPLRSLFTYTGKKKARKQELRDVVESTQAQISQLTQKGEILEKRTKEAEVQFGQNI